MKEWFLRFCLHVIWSRRKDFYYALTVISITGNVVALLGPPLYAWALSWSPALLAIATSSGVLFQATSSVILTLGTVILRDACALQSLHARLWSALPHVAESVLQRSVLYVVLHLILVRFVVKSGVLAGGKSNSSTQPPPEMTSARRNNEFLSTINVQILYGWNWFCPGYLQSICSTLLSLPDGVSSGACMHGGYGLARRIPSQVESAPAATRSISPETLHRQTIKQSRDQIMQLKDATSTVRSPSSPAAVPSLDQVLKLQDTMSTVRFAPTDTTFPPPESGASPCLFIIEPLDELAETDMSYCCKMPDVREAATVTVPALRKVDANTDSQHGVRARRKVARVRPDPVLHPSISDASSMRRGEDRRSVMRKGDCSFVRNKSAASLRGRDEESEKHSTEADMNDDELSHQEFNMKVDTFISKFKRNLTMQGEESLNIY